MWPSLEAATRAFDFASVVFIVSLVVGVLATCVIVWMGTVKEAHWDNERRTSNERIATLTTRGDEARAEIERAHESAEKARLESERLKAQLAWREVSAEQRERLADGLRGPQLHIRLQIVSQNPEAEAFAAQIRRVLDDVRASVTTDGLLGFPTYFGIIIAGPANDAASRVAEAFKTAGIDAQRMEEAGDLRLIVGHKPPPG